MSLPTVADCKAYLRLEPTDTTEDALLATLLARAIAACARYLGVPITAVSRAQTDLAESQFFARAPTALQLPQYPIDPGQAITVTDVDGHLVEATTYWVDGALGRIVGLAGTTFPCGPYTITATVGLSAATDYATVLEPTLNGAIMDCVADLYQNRSPNVRADSAGGGVSVTYSGDAMPTRAREALDLLRPGGLGL